MTSTDAKLKLSLTEFLELSETKPASEYIDGRIYQKLMPQTKHSMLQFELSSAINQVPEITEYLCDRTINKLILDRVNATLEVDPPQPPA